MLFVSGVLSPPLKMQEAFKSEAKKNIRTRPVANQGTVLSERGVHTRAEVAVSDFRVICMNSHSFCHSFNLTYLTVCLAETWEHEDQ